MPYVYILYSKSLDKFYIGVCKNSLESRIAHHNTRKYGTHKFTARAGDWSLFLKLLCDDFAHAVRMERKIKTMKSRKYIKNLKKYPELREKLFDITKGT